MMYIEDVRTVVKNNTTAKVLYVSQDIGNDNNNGSFLSQFKTIQAAVNAANLIAAYYNQVIIIVDPSSSGTGYNENITLSQQGVCLQSAEPTYRSEAAIIKGSITINLTGTSGGVNFVAASNIVYIKGFVISAASGDTITFSGSTFQRLFISDSYVDNSGTGSALVLTNTGVSSGTKSAITAHNCDLNNNSASNPTVKVSAGQFFISGTTYALQNGAASSQCMLVDGASAAGPFVTVAQAAMTGQVSVTDNTATIYLSLCTIASGSIAAIVTPSTPNVGFVSCANVGFTTTATNTVTGAGVLALLNNNVKLSTGGEVASTVTQVTVNAFPQGAMMLGAKATQTTNALMTLKDGHLVSQQTTAPTIAAHANAGTGASASLTNATDMAGLITLTMGSGSFATGTQVTVTFNKTFGTAPIVVFSPANANAAANAVLKSIYLDTITTSKFEILFNVAETSAGTVYKWNYMVIGTQ